VVQFAVVPICSSACEVGENPPRPTQNAENVGFDFVQATAGWFQRAETPAKVVAGVGIAGVVALGVVASGGKVTA
jgi:hypothetical protein